MPTTIADILTTMDYGPSPESPDAANQWLAQNNRNFGLFINGLWQAGTSSFTSFNPATGETLATLAQADAVQVDAAVQAASAAMPAWQAIGGHARARYLYALARALQKHARLFAVIETLDNGKPIRESRDVDVPLAIRHFYHHAGWAQLLAGEYPRHRALGVVGQIVPWNFPLLMLAWKIAPALACGNTVVFKPAEFTSLSAMLFAHICTEVGLPPGVVNIVTGDGATGQAIVEHPGIAKIAFTGSTEVGRRIRVATAGSGKRLSLELGGKSPFLVFADADLDAAVEGVVDSIMFNQGQVCCAGSRLLVQEGVQAVFLEKLRRRLTLIRVGDPLDKSTDMGALVDPSQRNTVARYVESARAEGAHVWQAPEWDQSDFCQRNAQNERGGCYFPPTVITNVHTASTVVQEEIFGPVVVVMSFRTPDEAVALANNTVFGLASCVWSESISLALHVAPQIKAGVVWINTANQFDAACGFGGIGESGFGREGGSEGLLEYLVEITEESRPDASECLPAVDAATVYIPETVAIDQTPKLYIGGKQIRPDGGYSLAVRHGERLLGMVPDGNRKDIRNAVEAAGKAVNWTHSSAHARAQVLYFIAENLIVQGKRFVDRLAQIQRAEQAQVEFDASVERLFYYAAWADKFDGRVHQPPTHGIVTALNEAVGNIGIVCPDEVPLLGLVSLMAPAICQGNRVVLLPSRRLPLVATDFYQVLDTSDLPGGVVNIVTGSATTLANVLAEHADVDALWRHDANVDGCATVERLSAANLKRTWVSGAKTRNWFDRTQGAGTEFLRQATHVKNIWVPYGV